MTTLEKIARAICLASGQSHVLVVTLDSIPPQTYAIWETFLPHARAAVEAMLEPSDEMCEAGYELLPELAEAYRAMLHAILSEEKKGE